MPSHRLSSKAALGVLLSASVSLLAQQSGTTASTEDNASAAPRFQSARSVVQVPSGPTALLRQLQATPRSAISLASGRFFSGGTGLVTGYALPGGGGVVSLQKADPAGNADSHFSATARFVAVDVRPDFVHAADLNGDGHDDLVVASRGGHAIQVLLADGAGNLAAQPALTVTGTITALASWRDASGRALIAAASQTPSGSTLDLISADGTVASSIAFPDSIGVLEVANVNRGAAADLIVGTASGLVVVDGRSLRPSSPLPVSNAVAVASGIFAHDERNLPQIAVLTADGSVHILARAGIESTPRARNVANAGLTESRGHSSSTPAVIDPTSLAWTDVEVLPGVAATGNTQPLLKRSRVSGSGGDDLLVFAGGAMTTIGHPIVVTPPSAADPAGSIAALPARISTEANTGSLTAALPLRVSPDARLGLVTANGSAQPLLTPLSAYKTLTVNTTADSDTVANETACRNSTANCTLRAAVVVSNSDATHNEGAGTADTILLPAATYVLSATTGTSGVDSNGNYDYHIEITGPVNIIATGGTATISGNSLDKIFSINSGYVVNQSGFDTYFSGIAFTNGLNRNNYSNGFADPLGGAIDGETYGTGFITFVSCTFTGNKAIYGRGGAIAVSDGILGSAPGPGVLEVDNSTFTSNQTAEAGGAIAATTTLTYANVPVSLNGNTFTTNSANKTLNSSDTYSQDQGGAVYFGIDSSSSHASAITSSIFSGNTAPVASGQIAAEGGGLYAGSGVSITNNQFLNNSAGNSGGGMYVASEYRVAVITGNTVTGNSSADAGGILITSDNVGGNGVAPTIAYNRIVGNTAPGSGRSGLGSQSLSSTDAYSTVTASENFWGCNTGANTTGCDAASAAGTGSTVLTPYAVVTASISSTSPTRGAPVTLTGSLNSDSTGTALPAGTQNAFTGVPGSTATFSGATVTNPGGTVSATLTLAQNGSTFSTATTPTNTSAQATLVATPPSSGPGTGTVHIDNATVTVNFVVPAPPTISQAFGAASIPVGGTTTLTFTLNNPNATGITGVGFTDNLPAGLSIKSPSGLSTTCNGTTTAAAGSTSISLSGSTLAAGASCTITVNVTDNTPGTATNTSSAISSNETGAGSTSTATLAVVAPPTIAEAFAPSSVAPNINSVVTFTLANPSANTVSLTGVAFSDTLPAGLNVSNPAGISNTCGGTVTAPANGGSIALSGATIASGANCSVSVNVSSAILGSYVNTTGAVTATNSNAGNTASATLTVTITPTKLVYTSVPPTPITAGGNAGTVSVALEDAAGNVATDNSGTNVTLTVTGPSGYSQVYNNTTTNGVASFNLSTVPLTIAGTYNYVATSGALTQASASQIVNPGAAASFTVTGLTGFTAPGASGTATVTARDAYGNVATSFTGPVTLSSSDPLASFSPASYTFVAGDAGVHTFTVTLNTAGTQTVTATSGALSGTEIGIVVADSIFIVNANGTTARLSSSGTVTSTSGTATAAGTLGGVATDNSGNAWSVTNSTSSVTRSNRLDTSSAVFSGGGINTPTSVAIDGLGAVWIANGNNTLSVLNNAGTAVSPSTGYTSGVLNTPSAVIVDNSGVVWVANKGNNTVTKTFGGAAPATTPLVNATTSVTQGARP